MPSKLTADPTASSASPLAHPAFRALWIAATVSYVGTFVQDTGERWMILELTNSPLPSAMLATVFVTASLIAMLPAGVLADRVDRGRLVILSQLAQATVAATLSVLSLLHLLSPKVLLCAAAAAGLGSALGSPAWSALVSEIVTAEQVADAVTFNAISFNIARAVGPAIGGVILAASGATATFVANACTFLGVIVAVATHRAPPRDRSDDPPATIGRSFAEPVIHAFRDIRIRSLLIAMVFFTLGASFVYVLAPALAKLTLKAGPRAYGLVIGGMGVGAVVGAILLKRLRAVLKPPALLGGLMLLYGVCAIALSQARSIPLAIAICIPAGIGWTGTFSSLSALVQINAPNRLRARAMAVYTLLHLGMWAIGASVSGALAESWGIRPAILTGGVICIAAGLVTLRMPLPTSFSRTA